MAIESVCTLSGKVTKIFPVRFTPNGVPIRELQIAVGQELLGEKSVGYFDLVISGEKALATDERFRIGRTLTVTGSLWMRKYRDRNGASVTEQKIVAEAIKEKKNEQKDG